MAEPGLDLPTQARRMLGQLERGEMTFTPRMEGQEKGLKGLQKAWNRVSRAS